MNIERLTDAFERAVRSLSWRTRASHLQRRTEAFLQLAQRDSGDRDPLWRIGNMCSKRSALPRTPAGRL